MVDFSFLENYKLLMSTRLYTTNKFERPFSPNHAMHLTLRTKIRKLRSRSVLGWLRKFIPDKAKYFGITLFHFAIIDNHLHLLIQAKERDALSGFLRVLSGVIARKVLGIEKGRKAAGRMWPEECEWPALFASYHLGPGV